MIDLKMLFSAYRNVGAFIKQIAKEGGIPMAVRKPKSTALKKLEGNPGKEN